jgi:outer membrane protein assembly factor BamB
MKVLRTLLVALFFLACSHEMPTKQTNDGQLPQWAMFGKNLRHTSNAADAVEYYPGPSQGQIVWTVDFGFFELSYSSPSIGPDGTIYLATTPARLPTDSGFVYAINPNGTIKWRFKTQRGNGATGAVGVDGTYYVSSGDRYFYAIGREGNLKWKRSLQSYYGPSYFGTERPAISQGGEVILPVYSGILSLDMDTGEISWFYETTEVHP